MPEIDIVADDEVLYRRVPNDPSFFAMQPNGAIRFSSTAFNDRAEKPSVDRGCLRQAPEDSKIATTDGIVSLITLSVRSITNIADTEAKDGEKAVYSIDVISRPIVDGNPEGEPENLAHAQIEAAPHFKASSRFKKLKEALAALANERGWLVTPTR